MKIPQLRRWRERQGLTQQELADRAGVSVRSIAGYEGGDGTRPNTARKLAGALGVTVADLIGEESQNRPEQDLRTFLASEVGHAFLATLSREELRDRAQEEGRGFRDACRQERDAVLQERKRFPASAGEITLFTSGEAYGDILRRYFTVSFADWSEEEAALEEERLMAETA